MRQGCRIVKSEKFSAIICGGETTDHICDNNGVVYETIDNKRHYFKNNEEARTWYKKEGKNIRMMSVTCSICERTAIDDSLFLI